MFKSFTVAPDMLYYIFAFVIDGQYIMYIKIYGNNSEGRKFTDTYTLHIIILLFEFHKNHAV